MHALTSPALLAHVSSHRSAHSVSHSQGDPDRHGPTGTPVLGTSQWHRAPPVLCSQSQQLCSGGSNESRRSRHLPGEGLRGRSSPRATLRQLQPQLDLCLLCLFSRCTHISLSASPAALQLLGPGLGCTLRYLMPALEAAGGRN